MTNRRIAVVGFELASDDVTELDLTSNASLLDYDIVLFKATIPSLFTYNATLHQGKDCLTDDASFRLKECFEHWRREIKNLVEVGKTVVVFLSELEQVFVATGSHSYSGTGRNRMTERHVSLYDNYRPLPISANYISSTGRAMKLAAKGAEVLAGYWSEFCDVSIYRTVLTDTKIPGSILTKAGDLAVGSVIRNHQAGGSLLLLPDIDFHPENFVKTKGEEVAWTRAAQQFADRFLAAIVALDKGLRSTGEITPPPAWASAEQFDLAPEREIRVKLLQAEAAVESAVKQKEEFEEALQNVGLYRALLYEKGSALERAIIDALRAFGFVAAPYKTSDSEFDVVFECPEGRLIGEAEGKDTKSINVDKLRQLSMNVHEDLIRQEVETAAKPVLFGNAFRLQELAGRGDPFTTKCLNAASTSSTALVFTPDLYISLQYLLGKSDPEYARNCRLAIIATTGRVVFPMPPVDESSPITSVDNTVTPPPAPP